MKRVLIALLIIGALCIDSIPVHSSGVAVPPTPARAAVHEAETSEPEAWETTASWTGRRPKYCYDRHEGQRATRTRVPKIPYWTAHKTLPCGTQLEVTGENGTVVVEVWDRGPYKRGRDLDLSKAAFEAAVGSRRKGLGRVTFREVSQ